MYLYRVTVRLATQKGSIAKLISADPKKKSSILKIHHWNDRIYVGLYYQKIKTTTEEVSYYKILQIITDYYKLLQILAKFTTKDYKFDCCVTCLQHIYKNVHVFFKEINYASYLF